MKKLKPLPTHSFTVEWLVNPPTDAPQGLWWWTQTSAVREARRKLGHPGKPQRWKIVRYDKSEVVVG